MRLSAGAIFAAHGAQKLFGSFGGGGKLSLDRLLSARLSNGRSDSFYTVAFNANRQNISTQADDLAACTTLRKHMEAPLWAY